MSNALNRIEGTIAGLRDCMLHRLTCTGEADDKRASVLAEELMAVFERIEYPLITDCGSPDHAKVDAGILAQELLLQVSKNDSFPQTISVLWNAVIKAWLVNEAALSIETEKEFARFIAHGSFCRYGENTRKKILARVREGLGTLDGQAAYRKILRFLQAADVEKDSSEIVRAIMRSIGQCAPIQEVTFVSHILGNLTNEEGYTPATLALAAPAAAEQVSRLIAMALDMTVLTPRIDEACQGWIAEKVQASICVDHIQFMWRIGGSERAQEEAVKLLCRDASKVIEERRAEKGHVSPIVLVCKDGTAVRARLGF